MIGASWRSLERALSLALATVLIALPLALGAQERITSFHAEISIRSDGSLHVTETIEVEALGQTIRRGILRDFPTEYRDRAGNRVVVPFEVESVLRADAPEQWTATPHANGVRVQIGRADVLLPPGRHRYEIRYRTARQLGFFTRHDELYWNVTGNGWPFAIDAASASVELPQPVPAAQLSAEAYTGPQGARGAAWNAQVRAGAADFRSTQRLGPREGLTIVLTFPKGIVAQPTTGERLRWYINENRGAGAALCGLLMLTGWLALRWRLVGRDPSAGPLFPRYLPPEGLSPAAVRYVDRMGFDGRCFASGILGLGARGVLRVEAQGQDFAIERTATNPPAWLVGEKSLADALFSQPGPFTMGKAYNPQVETARNALSSALAHHYNGVLFSRNRGSLAIGGLLGVLTVVATIALGAGGAAIAITIIASGALLVAFARWMPSYSVAGRRLKDEIAGLRQYLGVAERDSLARMQAPELTPQEFARMLPYALALDVERTWADRFAAIAGSAATAAAVDSYYTHQSELGGQHDIGWSVGGMAETISAASTPPGSSSGSSDAGGSGGGGSSGGGGGGGGGGGW